MTIEPKKYSEPTEYYVLLTPGEGDYRRGVTRLCNRSHNFWTIESVIVNRDPRFVIAKLSVHGEYHQTTLEDALTYFRETLKFEAEEIDLVDMVRGSLK